MDKSSTGATLTGGEPFVWMEKPVGPLCNLQCGYCYYLEQNSIMTLRHIPHVLRYNVLETYVRQYIEENPGPQILHLENGRDRLVARPGLLQEAVRLAKNASAGC